jgi:hypothetical protein
MLRFSEDMSFVRDEQGELDVTLCIDALTAYEAGLIEESVYRDLLHRVNGKLSLAGFEALDLTGNHLLLAMNPDGVLRTDNDGELEFTMCNFELTVMHYCRLR